MERDGQVLFLFCSELTTGLRLSWFLWLFIAENFTQAALFANLYNEGTRAIMIPLLLVILL
jgi:hypothetical protein